MAHLQPPNGHPAVDWSNWSPPGPNDVRSPCPVLNALANHGILPHNGKGISKGMAITALNNAFHIDYNIASLLTWCGLATNPDHSSRTFDLNHLEKHGGVEHDCSLSREDVCFGSNAEFNKERWVEVFKIWKDGAAGEGGVGTEETSWKSTSEARYERVKLSKERHEKAGKPFDYGIKEAVLSYGESALFLNVLGKDGKAPLEWVRIVFEDERVPYAEGWRPPTKVDQSMMNHAILKLMEENERKGEEAITAGMGTVHAMQVAVSNLIKASKILSSVV